MTIHLVSVSGGKDSTATLAMALELGPTGNPFLDLSILKGRFPSRRALTPDQLKWHREWNGGTLAIVDSPEAALRVLGLMAHESENRNQRELTAAL